MEGPTCWTGSTFSRSIFGSREECSSRLLPCSPGSAWMKSRRNLAGTSSCPRGKNPTAVRSNGGCPPSPFPEYPPLRLRETRNELPGVARHRLVGRTLKQLDRVQRNLQGMAASVRLGRQLGGIVAGDAFVHHQCGEVRAQL